MKRYTITQDHPFYNAVVALSSSQPDNPDGSNGHNPFYWYSYGMDETTAPVKYTAVVEVPGPIATQAELNPAEHMIVGEKIPHQFSGRTATIADTEGPDLIVTVYDDREEFESATKDEQDKAAEYWETVLLHRVNTAEKEN